MITTAVTSREDLIRQLRTDAIAAHHKGQDCNFTIGCESLAKGQEITFEFCEFPYCANQCHQWIKYALRKHSMEAAL